MAGPGQVPAGNAVPVIVALADHNAAGLALDAAARAAIAQELAAESAQAAAHAADAGESAAAAAAMAAPQAAAAEQVVVPAQPEGVGAVPAAVPGPAGPAPAGPAPAGLVPAEPAPAAGDGAIWDTEHKRDEDRSDTQHTLDNTRWDTQHTLDNTRWDTRHTLENTRWDTYLALRHSREDAATAAEATLLGAVQGGYLAIAQGSLDRAVQRATYVTTAAGAIATLYTGILGLRFTSGQPALPARSLIPALFIGAAVAFSTFYMAFLRGSTKRRQLLPTGLGGNIAETRLLEFMEWSFGGVLARAWSLRLSVISLALGLAFLPIGFVQVSRTLTWTLALLAVALLVLWIGSEIYLAVAGPPPIIGDLMDKRDRRPSKLARTPDPLPQQPAHQDAPDSGLQPFGMPAPPARPQGAEQDQPPASPPSATSAMPPAPPGPIEPGPRPAPTPTPPATPTQIEVVLHTVQD